MEHGDGNLNKKRCSLKITEQRDGIYKKEGMELEHQKKKGRMAA